MFTKTPPDVVHKLCNTRHNRKCEQVEEEVCQKEQSHPVTRHDRPLTSFCDQQDHGQELRNIDPLLRAVYLAWKKTSEM